MNDRHCDVAIIGAGIVGLAVGVELLRKNPAINVVVLDKELEVASHQTGHNSGVMHSGLYYKPGSLKARLCVEGRTAMVQFCRENGIPYEICGKIIVATEEREIPGLNELLRRGKANGVPGLRELNPEQIREIEPHTSGLKGLHVPGTGITDFKMVSAKYAELIEGRGGEVLIGHCVERIARDVDAIVLETPSSTIHARFAINCAGLNSDRVAKMAGAHLGLRIVPFRGEYYELVPSKHHLIKGLVYPVADPRFPFLGVHFTRRIHGGVEAGPNAVLSLKREGYTRTSFNLADAFSTMSFPGFWKMASQNWKSGVGEMYRSWSKRAFTCALQKLLPELTEQDIQPGGSGVRAQALDRSGKLLDDFHFVYQDRFLHVCNVPSPAATASLVIGREIVLTLEGNADSKRVQVAMEGEVGSMSS
ncbi:MAG TPA: L-2-hydroxyglutarate oxidase [Acidobacteriaceae bacterium]|nr:L-2-hydroxyglutarate oxidase [Acidobacteriaceae bacterium]